MKKAIITGPPFSGKSTLVKKLRELYPRFVFRELDELLIEMNGGIWPDNETYRNGILVPKVIDEVINSKDRFIFFTSYISPKDIKRAKRKGFLFFQLSCSRKVLIDRNVNNEVGRQKEMDRNLRYQSEIRNIGLVDKELDCEKPTENLIESLSDIFGF